MTDLSVQVIGRNAEQIAAEEEAFGPRRGEFWSDVETFMHQGTRFPRLFIPILSTRLGAHIFIVRLEHTHYPPGRPENRDFQMMRLRWQDLEWWVVSIPDADKRLAEDVAARTGMRLADGVPTVFEKLSLFGAPALALGSLRKADADTVDVFPLSGPEVWTLENDANSKLDRMRQKIDRQYALEAESKEAQAIVEKHQERLRAERNAQSSAGNN